MYGLQHVMVDLDGLGKALCCLPRHLDSLILSTRYEVLLTKH